MLHGEVDISNTSWVMAEANESDRRAFIHADFDTADWRPAAVPGHWQAEPTFELQGGPVLYRTRLSLNPQAGQRHWLVFDGIHHQADVWFDSRYLGPTEASFVRHQFEVTSDVETAPSDAGSTIHVLAAEVAANAPGAPGKPTRDIVGVWGDAETVGPEWTAGGITGPVTVVHTGPVRLWNMRMVCSDTSTQRATISCGAQLLSQSARDVSLITTVTGPDGQICQSTVQTHHLTQGATTVEWQVDVDQPELWWPRQLGSQPLYNVAVSVLCDGAVSDDERRPVGLRAIEFNKYQFSINGQQLFLKGANYWPTDRALANCAASKIAADVASAIELNLDLLRVHGHVGRPELYEEADRQGLLIWQDFPLRGPAARGIRDKAKGQAEHLVYRLGHHPSVVAWCAHDDPAGTSRRPDRKASAMSSAKNTLAQQLPSWNKSVLDRAVSSSIEKLDASRPIISRSGMWPSPPLFDSTDTHLWFGWAAGRGRDLVALARNLPLMVRWVSAFGAQSVPTDANFCGAHRWPDLHWSELQGAWGLDRRAMAAYVPTQDHESFDSWVEATQAYQATLLRRQIELLRTLKYNPTGGFCFSAFADCRPAISFAIADHNRRPKAGWQAVKDACASVIVTAERLPTGMAPGHALTVEMHVVNDRHEALPVHILTAKLGWGDNEHHTWTWRGLIPADSVQRIGRLDWIAPNTPGPVTLDLTLTHKATGEVVAHNSYQTRIAR